MALLDQLRSLTCEACYLIEASNFVKPDSYIAAAAQTMLEPIQRDKEAYPALSLECAAQLKQLEWLLSSLALAAEPAEEVR